MQLILNADTDIRIKKKMSTIQQESFKEKFSNEELIEKIDSNIENVLNENNDSANNQDIMDVCNENGNVKVTAEETVDTDNTSNYIISNKEVETADSKDKIDTERDDKENEGIEETNEREPIKPDQNKGASELDTENNHMEISVTEFEKNTEIKESFKEEDTQIKNDKQGSKKDDNVENDETDKQKTNTLSKNQFDKEELEVKTDQEIPEHTEKVHVRDEEIPCVETIQKKVEPHRNDNVTILESDVNKIKEIDEIGNKNMFTSNQTENNVIVDDVKPNDQNAKDSSNDCFKLSDPNEKQNINVIYDTESIAEELKETINENNANVTLNSVKNTNETEAQEKKDTEEIKENEEVVDFNMEIDDKTTALSEDIKETPITQDNIENMHNQDRGELIINKNVIEEVIDIADEKDEDSKSKVEKEISENVTKQNESNTEKNNTSVQVMENKLSNNDNQEVKVSTSEEANNNLNSVTPNKDSITATAEQITSNKNNEERKKLTHISKLSNTLDILSDDEDPPKDVSTNAQSAVVAIDKQCISIEDDDDIMLIDEDPNTSTNNETETENLTHPLLEDPKNEEKQEEHKSEEEENKDIKITKTQDIQDNSGPKVTSEAENDNSELKQEKSIPENSELKPLLPVNFLKTCKKNFADMTRDELEEFCILKIVESVVDRSNLSEIKSQLKTMAQNIDEYKKKALMITKQNRDLQVVLKSVQEEQKKKSDTPITPLKITRSVGIQVLINDKTGVRRKPQQGTTNTQNNSSPSRPAKSQINHNSRFTKTNSNSSATIPVPRLVPAVNNSNLNNIKILPAPPANSPAKSQVTNSISNGPPSLPPTQKPEKRPHNRIQQNNSVTVDLTDDEPPAKLIQRNVTPPVRLVNPQNLLAPHRQQFSSNINSPRKVYIPISGSQSQSIRPGQTIMLKTIPAQGPRQRCPTPGIPKPNQSPNILRMQKSSTSRHPAPLPDSTKQYQPPNWKNLPPAPNLSLSKVENGIVISWKIDGYQEENHEEIASYQLYAYQETLAPPSTALWKKIGDVKALPLPMACTLTQFMSGYKYYFAVRAVDVRSRLGPFSIPGSILLLNKM